MFFLSVICLALQVLHLHSLRYDGFRLLHVHLPEERAMDALNFVIDNQVDVWSSGPDYMQLFLNPKQASTVLQYLQRENFHHNSLHDNMQELIDAQILKPEEGRREKRQTRLVPNCIVGRYVSYDEIVSWLQTLAATYPSIVNVSAFGKTYEKRNLFLIKIGTNTTKSLKPAVWLDGGVHAREWISPATMVYVIYKLIEAHQSTDINQLWVKDIDFYIAPVLNPDGYNYTFKQARMWRKNRSPNAGFANCSGTDINRNFPFHWAEGGAISRSACSEVYTGRAAGSELETQAVMAVLHKYNRTLKVYITVHSYSQLWLTRWSYMNSTISDDSLNLAIAAVDMINKTSGVIYKAGSAPSLLYSYSGGSEDWARGVAGIPYSYGVELRDTGRFGFLLPDTEIIPVGEEFFAALQIIANHTIHTFKT